MKNRDRALSIHHPRVISAFYFGLLALIATGIVDSLITTLIIGEELLPTYKVTLIATPLAVCFGAIFGEKIMRCKRPYTLKAFLYGAAMTLAALPFFALFYLIAMSYHFDEAFMGANFTQMFFIYFVVLAQVFLFVGIWAAIFSGLAALYLRGQLSYDLLHTHYQKTRNQPLHHHLKKAHAHRTILH